MSEISKDLALFNELVEVLINEEQKNPVADRIDANQLYKTLDLSLNDSAMVDDSFKTVLRDVLISTPKTATNLFSNQLFGGRQSKAVLGDLLAVESLNRPLVSFFLLKVPLRAANPNAIKTKIPFMISLF